MGIRLANISRARLTSGAKAHACIHVRQGNNEIGDWASKKWRHVSSKDIETRLMQAVLTSKSFVESENITFYVASDTAEAEHWFLHETRYVKVITHIQKRPAQGVWFGESGSKTAKSLSAHE